MEVEEDGLCITVDDSCTTASRMSSCTSLFCKVLYDVHDINGKVHQAVRIGVFYDKHGLPSYNSASSESGPKLCYNCTRKNGQCSSNVCRTRVMCLQCGIPLCFPLRTIKDEERQSSCFAKHVDKIKKNPNRVRDTFTEAYKKNTESV